MISIPMVDGEAFISIRVPVTEVKVLLDVLNNYLDHYTEEDSYNGEPEIPLFMMRLFAGMIDAEGDD
jgi:hypothetical protein